MRFHLTLALAAIGGGLATPALAQEAAPFTGPHVEGLLGYDNLSNGSDGVDDSSDGVLYGVGAGYDFQLGSVIAGIEGEYTDSSTKARGRDVDLIGDEYRLNTGRDLYIGGRIGYAVAPSTMLYAKAGYTNARIKARYNDGLGATFRESATLDGFRVGAGIEQKFNLLGPSGFVKAEYRYSNYSNLDLPNDIDAKVDTDRHQVLAGIGVRF